MVAPEFLVHGGQLVDAGERKPSGCSDFPVDADPGDIIADLRCKAVAPGAPGARIARAVGPEFRIAHSADAERPFLATLSVRRVADTASGGKRRRN